MNLPARIKQASPFGALQTARFNPQAASQLMQLSQELKEAGFKRVLEKHSTMLAPERANLLVEHLTFNSQDIGRFLRGEAEKYTAAMGFDSFKPFRNDNGYNDIVLSGYMSKQSGVWSSETQEQTVEFKWQETRVDEYETAPPLEVIRKIAEHRKRRTFDYITIAELKINVLETRTIKRERAVSMPGKREIPVDDPLALGRFIRSSGSSSDNDVRYLIAQWDDDIDLNALMGSMRR